MRCDGEILAETTSPGNLIQSSSRHLNTYIVVNILCQKFGLFVILFRRQTVIPAEHGFLFRRQTVIPAETLVPRPVILKNQVKTTYALS